jgi:hypothetical protein
MLTQHWISPFNALLSGLANPMVVPRSVRVRLGKDGLPLGYGL